MQHMNLMKMDLMGSKGWKEQRRKTRLRDARSALALSALERSLRPCDDAMHVPNARVHVFSYENDVSDKSKTRKRKRSRSEETSNDQKFPATIFRSRGYCQQVRARSSSFWQTKRKATNCRGWISSQQRPLTRVKRHRPVVFVRSKPSLEFCLFGNQEAWTRVTDSSPKRQQQPWLPY